MKKWMTSNEETISPKVLLLYEAVRELLSEDVDVNNLKISDITQRAGIGKGTAYDYFDSKEEVIIQGVMYHFNRLMETVERSIEEHSTFHDQIRYFLDVIDDNLNQNGCFLKVIRLLLGSSQISGYLQQAVRDGCIKNPLQLLEQIVRQGQESGEVRTEYPTAYIVFTICARLLSYAALADSREEDCLFYSMKVDIAEMRKMMYHGIMQEFCGEVKDAGER